jgi:hypothetical protein
MRFISGSRYGDPCPRVPRRAATDFEVALLWEFSIHAIPLI